MHSYVQDVMTTAVVTVAPHTPYRALAALLHRDRISGVPVVDADGIVVGVVSETDLLDPRRDHPAQATAASLMTCPAVTIGPDAPVSHAARMMHTRKLRRLPVVDRGGHLLGIVTRSDVLSAFTRPDEQIRLEINQDVIADGFFTDPDRLTVTVERGIVTLSGEPGSVVLGRSIAERARHVEGVVAVRDRFTYPAVPAHPGQARRTS